MNDSDGRQKGGARSRAAATRERIVAGAIDVLARCGVSGLTHRDVARAAGVSLAATTYHFDSKAHILEAASSALLDGYLHAFRQLAARIARGEEERTSDLTDLVQRVVLNALGRERTRSLAWSELILHDGRKAAGRELARVWYARLDGIWQDIARRLEPDMPIEHASVAVDLAIGLTFTLQPLGLELGVARDLLDGRRDMGALLEEIAGAEPTPQTDTPNASPEPPARYQQTRRRILDAATEIIVKEGAAALTHRRVAELTGMVRSGPSYYFATIDELLATAQQEFFARAKARYRSGFEAAGAADIDESQLLDLTTAIFFREALEHASENIGFHSAWISAAQNPSLRGAAVSSLLNLHRAWTRRLSAARGQAPEPALPLRMHAIFTGKLIRAVTAAIDVSDLARARSDFATLLRGAFGAKATSCTIVQSRLR